MDMTCYTCGGSGEYDGKECITCGGSGTVVVSGDQKIFRHYLLAIYPLVQELPTKTQMLEKFTDLQEDIELLKQGVQAIWNKIKDM